MRRGFAAAVMMMLGGAIASAAGQAPLRLEATPSESQAQGTSTAGHSAGTSQTTGATANGGATGAQAPTQGATATSHGSHFVTVKFDYDFAKTPACSAKVKVKTACVEEFVAYDISGGVKHWVKLFEIPLPPKPVGLVPGITQKSPMKLDFESGKHLISVVAREPDGTESRHRACTTWIEIP
jgi:hypothetical protein